MKPKLEGQLRVQRRARLSKPCGERVVQKGESIVRVAPSQRLGERGHRGPRVEQPGGMGTLSLKSVRALGELLTRHILTCFETHIQILIDRLSM